MGDLDGYQRLVDEAVHRQAKKGESPYWPVFVILARLVEETGEISRELNHLYGPKKKKPGEKKGSVGNEIADAIFTLICLANTLGIELDPAMKKAIDKCDKRDRNRFKGKK